MPGLGTICGSNIAFSDGMGFLIGKVFQKWAIVRHTPGKKSAFLTLLVFAVALMLANSVAAQYYADLYDFSNILNGSHPYGTLIQSGNTLYGTTVQGGSTTSDGTVFAVNTDGTGFTNLHIFSSHSFGTGTNSDGAQPGSGLLLSGDALYGTATIGGVSAYGTIFKVNTDGSSFTNLHNFPTGVRTNSTSYNITNSDGAVPRSALVISGNTLYGTAAVGGSGGSGTVFAINTDGTGFTNLYTFSTTSGSPAANSDGATPVGLVLCGNTLYGAANNGGVFGCGTLFSLKTDGTAFTNLHSFARSKGASPNVMTLGSNVLYGTTSSGGSAGNGTVFIINTDGSGFMVLHHFTSDGRAPYGQLSLSGETLYGTTASSSNGAGIVFALNTDGNGFTTLHAFEGTNGSTPFAGVILSSNILYGAASTDAGSTNNGTIYSISLAPILTINISGTNAVVTWPTQLAGFDYSGFTLQSTTNLTSPDWTAVSPAPVAIAGLETVTNAISGPQMFYRLSR